MLDNAPNQPSKFWINNRIEINVESQGTYYKDNQVRFRTLRSSLCGYSDSYILVKGIITVTNTAAWGQPNNGNTKEAIFKNFEPFTDCICRINNTQGDDAHDIHVVMI